MMSHLEDDARTACPERMDFLPVYFIIRHRFISCGGEAVMNVTLQMRGVRTVVVSAVLQIYQKPDSLRRMRACDQIMFCGLAKFAKGHCKIECSVT